MMCDGVKRRPRAGEAQQKQRPVKGGAEIHAAGPAKLLNLSRGDGCCSPCRTAMLASDATECLADCGVLGIERIAPTL
jgi:hypothetical protein